MSVDAGSARTDAPETAAPAVAPASADELWLARIAVGADGAVVAASSAALRVLPCDPRGDDLGDVLGVADPDALAAALASPAAGRVDGARFIGHLAPAGAATRDVFLEPATRTSDHHALVADALVAIVAATRDGTIVVVNRFAEQLFGYCAGELLGRPVETLIPAPDRSRHRALRVGYDAHPVGRPMDGGRVLTAVRRDGTTFPVEISLGVADTPHGPLHQAIVVDVSARVAATAALAASIARRTALADLGRLALTASLQQLMDAAADAIGRCLDAGVAAVCELACNGGSLRVRSWAGDVAGPLAAQEFSALPGTAAAYVLARLEPVLDDELVAAGCFAGSPQQLVGMASGASVRITGAGARAYGILHAHFAARRPLGEEEVRFLRSVGDVLAVAVDRARRDPLFELSADLLAVVDTESGFLVDVNPACEPMLGWRPDELRARPFADFVHPDDRAQALAAYAELAAPNAQLVDFDTRVTTRDGDHKHLLVSARSDADGRWIYVAAKDITERRAREADAELRRAAEETSRAKSEFLSRMSHELRTPMNAVLGFGQLLERAGLEEREARYVRHVLAGGRHLLTLIDEVLEISRIESGSIGLSREPVAVDTVLRETVDLIEPLAAERGIDVRLDLAETGGGYVLADYQRMKQILLNLLSNAVKYNREGGAIGVTARAEEDVLVVAVSDTGPGIAPELLPRLFSPFDRLGAEASEIAGTGLGLALSRRLAEAMEGSIAVASEVGAGSTFELRLQRTSAPQAIASAPPDRPRQPSRACSVLYVEDNLANLNLVEAVLAEDDITVTPAATGRLGIDLAASLRPDVVLLDLHLPDIPGWEVLAALRSRPETASLPVVVVTADATESQRRRMLALGVAAHLTKPLDVDELRAALADACPGAGSAHAAV